LIHFYKRTERPRGEVCEQLVVNYTALTEGSLLGAKIFVK